MGWLFLVSTNCVFELAYRMVWYSLQESIKVSMWGVLEEMSGDGKEVSRNVKWETFWLMGV